MFDVVEQSTDRRQQTAVSSVFSYSVVFSFQFSAYLSVSVSYSYFLLALLLDNMHDCNNAQTESESEKEIGPVGE